MLLPRFVTCRHVTKRGKLLDMKKFEQRLLPIARQWAGNIPVWAAKEAGIDPSALRHWAKDNPDVTNNLRGVYTWYCDDDKINWEYCSTARLLAKAGKGAYLWGPSVLELMEIGDVGSPDLFIAVPKRRRPQFSVKWIVTGEENKHKFKGLPMQSLKKAVLSALPILNEDPEKKESVILDLMNRSSREQKLAKQIGAEFGI